MPNNVILTINFSPQFYSGVCWRARVLTQRKCNLFRTKILLIYLFIIFFSVFFFRFDFVRFCLIATVHVLSLRAIELFTAISIQFFFSFCFFFFFSFSICCIVTLFVFCASQCPCVWVSLWSSHIFLLQRRNQQFKSMFYFLFSVHFLHLFLLTIIRFLFLFLFCSFCVCSPLLISVDVRF